MNINTELKNTAKHSCPPSWYKQFWPWFLILLPSTTVCASIVTIYLAFSNPDPIVKNDDQRLGPVLTEKTVKG